MNDARSGFVGTNWNESKTGGRQVTHQICHCVVPFRGSKPDTRMTCMNKEQHRHRRSTGLMKYLICIGYFRINIYRSKHDTHNEALLAEWVNAWNGWGHAEAFNLFDAFVSSRELTWPLEGTLLMRVFHLEFSSSAWNGIYFCACWGWINRRVDSD